MTRTSSPRLTARRFAMPLLCLLALCLSAPASHADNKDQLGINLTISPGDGQFTQRFSWLHWWETQRPAQQRFDWTEQRAAWSVRRLAVVEPNRQQLIDTLVPIVKDASADPYAKAGAVMALARMRYEKLADLIVSDEPLSPDHRQIVSPSGENWPRGLIGDENVRVRVAGWMALGILDTEESRAKLVNEFNWAVMTDDEIARVTAFGFISELSKAERDFLIMKMRNSEVAEVQRMALWALQQHDSKANDAIMGEAIQTLISPYSVSQAILAEGTMQRQKPYELLAKIIGQPGALDDITVFRTIKDGNVWQSPFSFGVDKQLSVSAMLALTKLPPAEGNARSDIKRALDKAILEGPSRPSENDPGVVRSDNLNAPIANYERGPAALALAMQTDGRFGLSDNLRTLESLLDGKTKTTELRYPRDERGKIDRDAAPVLVEKVIEQQEHPARGYAAVAMGLLMQRMDPGAKLGQENPLVLVSKAQAANVMGDLSRPLLKALGNTHELTDVRCAAAIGLGLSGQQQFRAPLLAALKKLRPGEEALYGYIVEALAMLDDPSVPKLVSTYLEQVDEIRSDNDQLARRALASALIFSTHTTPDDVDELVESAWSADPYVGIALAKASAVRGGGKLFSYMLKQADDAHYAGAATVSLAEMVDVQTPWRLSSLTEDMNYTQDYRTPLQVITNYYTDKNAGNPSTPSTQAPLPTRMVSGFDNPYLVHSLLTRRMPTTSAAGALRSGGQLDNDDSNGTGGFMFDPAERSDNPEDNITGQ